MLPYLRSMEAFFDLSLPKSWADLSDPQLLFFFRQLATDKPMAEIQTLCLCQWANVLVRCRLYGSVYLVQHGKQQATLTLHQFVCAITALDFLKSFSPYPIRIRTIGKARPMEADFQGVPFSTFISADNYYQGFLHTKNETLLSHLATLLYPKVKKSKLSTPLLLNTFYWFSSQKHYFAQRFPHFLQPMSADEQNLLGYAPPIGEVLRTAMNAQIHALTGGDITKEEAVLSMDTWRALTELDAKAKEVEDIKRNDRQEHQLGCVIFL